MLEEEDAYWYNSLSTFLVGWPSGLRRRFAKPLRGKTLAQVRILSLPQAGEVA